MYVNVSAIVVKIILEYDRYLYEKKLGNTRKKRKGKDSELSYIRIQINRKANTYP